MLRQIDSTTDGVVNHLSDHSFIAFQCDCPIKTRKTGRIIFPNSVIKREAFLDEFKNCWEQSMHLNPMERFHYSANKGAVAAKCFTFELGGRKKLFSLSTEDHKVYVDMLSEAHKHKGILPGV